MQRGNFLKAGTDFLTPISPDLNKSRMKVMGEWMVYYYHYLWLLKKTIGKCQSLADTKNMTLIRPLLFSGATIHCSRQKAQEQPTGHISAARMCPGPELVIQQGRPEASKTSQDWTESSQDIEKQDRALAGMGWPVLKPEDLLTIT